MNYSQSKYEDMINNGGDAFLRFFESAPDSPVKSAASKLLHIDTPMARLQIAQVVAFGILATKANYTSRNELANAVLAVSIKQLDANGNEEIVRKLYTSAVGTAALAAKEENQVPLCEAIVTEGVNRINRFSNPAPTLLEDRESLYMDLSELYMDQGDIDKARNTLDKVAQEVLSRTQMETFKSQETRLKNLTGGIDKSTNEFGPEQIKEMAVQIESVLEMLSDLPMAMVPSGLVEELKAISEELKNSETVDTDLAVIIQKKLESISSLMEGV